MVDKELFKSIFCHRPDWRYQLAKEFAGRRNSKLPVQCPLVNDCRAFLRQQARSAAGTSPRRNPRLSKRYQPLSATFEIYCNAAYEQLKIKVEARIVAKQYNDEIALVTGLRENICELYELVFFPVRNRLDATDYILLEVIGWTFSGELMRPLRSVSPDWNWRGTNPK
jgi:hypothetical protein